MIQDNQKQQLQSLGVDIKLIEDQILKFKNGIIPTKLIQAATLDKGIYSPNENRRKYYISLYEEYTEYRKIVKFVPASGAASRMFKEIFSCVEELSENTQSQEEILKKHPKAKEVIENISNFAFNSELINILTKDGLELEKLLEKKDFLTIFKYILDKKGLNYSNLPKALLHFHKYDEVARLAMDEHLVEGANYAQNFDNEVNIHFTISPEHETWFNENLNKKISEYENKYNVKYNISYSFQHPSTDTIAVDLNNELFIDKDHKLVFRPAGHGALIKNLNELEEDLIFIKNIDNITTDSKRQATYDYKKIIAGILLDKEISIQGNLELLQQSECSDQDIEEIAEFIVKIMNENLIEDFNNLKREEKISYLQKTLNRPIRVCGMVKNEGEPGGGPFFVKDSEGKISLQIVEKSQIDINNPEQLKILKESTHFNPVDIVASLVDFNGNKFNLDEFIDHETYIISEKSKDGKALKALELPGLWNGAMAKWISFFVEVPLETFSPVKEINDLLRPEHKN